MMVEILKGRVRLEFIAMLPIAMLRSYGLKSQQWVVGQEVTCERFRAVVEEGIHLLG
jgi:hypothetical protein